MSVHLFNGPIAGAPPEPLLLEAVTIRLIQNSERERFDEELVTKHYLKNANAVGRVLGMSLNIETSGLLCWSFVRRLFTSNSGTSGCTGYRAKSKSGGISSRRMPGFWCWPLPASGPIWPRGY